MNPPGEGLGICGVGVSETQQEIATLSQGDSEYVTQYCGSIVVCLKSWVIIEFPECDSSHDLLEAEGFSKAHVAIIYRELLLGLDYLHSGGAVHHDIGVDRIIFEEVLKLSGKLFERHRRLFLCLPHIRPADPLRIHLQAGACRTRTASIPSRLNFVAFFLIRHAIHLIFPRPARCTCIPSHPEHSYLYYLLSGNYSQTFEDFVSLRLNKDPSAVSFPSKHQVYPSQSGSVVYSARP